MFAKSVAVFALLFAASASALQVNTPGELQTCKDVDFTWDDGAPKYLLALVHGNDPCGDAIFEFGETSDKKQTWKVNVPAGTQVQPVLIDSSGTESWGGVITVKDSGDSSCIPGAKVESVSNPPTSTSATKPATSTPAKVNPPSNNGGVANVEQGTNNNDTGAAASSFVISSAAVAGVIGAAALLF